jgi:hypothetical protein
VVRWQKVFSARTNIKKGRLWHGGLLAFLLILVTADGFCQIGGRTSSEGPFTLDNVEDINTTASGVDRAWIPEYIVGYPQAFGAVTLTDKSSTLMPGQSPLGALLYTMPTQPKAGYVSYSLGVPMPSVPGAPTTTHPGDISSFTHLTFLIRSDKTLANQFNQVILETYAGTSIPKLVWNFERIPGPQFHRVTLPLHAPDAVQGAGTVPVSELLAKTRYLSFYFYGGRELTPTTLTVYIDDIALFGNSAIEGWSLY